MITLSVIGLGYIGLPTAALFASRNIAVHGVDINPDIVNKVNCGEIHFIEPDLDIIVSAAVSAGYLQASLKIEPADVFIIAVPTPFTADHQADLSYIQNAVRMLAPVLRSGNLVILESTSPVGTTELLEQWLSAERPDLVFPSRGQDSADIHIAYCPERVLPGHILKELIQNHRVIGGLTPFCAQQAKKVYAMIVEGECFLTDARMAELCKLAENAYRDVNIAFANELSMVCESLDVNVWQLIRLANQHPRVDILQPGPGVGGHCIAVDPWFIVSSAPQYTQLIKTARLINEHKPHWVISQIVRKVASFLQMNPEKNASDVVIACFGLTYKPDIDDLRESPALFIAQKLAKQHVGTVLAVEPNIQALPNHCPPSLELCSWQAAVEKAHILIILVDHKEFKAIPAELWKPHQILDVRGILEHA